MRLVYLLTSVVSEMVWAEMVWNGYAEEIFLNKYFFGHFCVFYK